MAHIPDLPKSIESTAMNKLFQKLLQVNTEWNLISEDDCVLCCVSGGADSIALLHLLTKNAEVLKITVCAVHVNHGLRGTESDAEEAFVRDFCQRLKVPLFVRRVSVKHEASLEAAARVARYQAFHEVANECSCNRIATAHTADDNAETVLFHLARGAGGTGLCGIPYVRENVIRPLLNCNRKDVLAYLQENQLEYCTDSSNESLVFSRNRIRKKVLPELQKAHPGAIDAINRASTLLRVDTDYFRLETDRCMRAAVVCEETLRYPIEKLLCLHEALRNRVIQRMAEVVSKDAACHLEQQHISSVCKLLVSDSPSAEVHLPFGVVARRAYQELVFSLYEQKEPTPCFLEEGSSVLFGRYRVTYSSEKPVNVHKNFILYQVNSAIINNRLYLRKRKVGDRLKLPGRFCKTLKSMMIDGKIEKQMRDELPVISDGEHVVLVHGFGVDERYCVSSDHPKKYIEIGLCEE